MLYQYQCLQQYFQKNISPKLKFGDIFRFRNKVQVLPFEIVQLNTLAHFNDLVKHRSDKLPGKYLLLVKHQHVKVEGKGGLQAPLPINRIKIYSRKPKHLQRWSLALRLR